METKDLNEEQLHEYFLEHIRYEIQKVIHLSWAIKQSLSCHETIKFAPVESYAIHFRNLVTFLYPFKPHNDDVCAKHFFIQENTWNEIRPDLGDILKKAKTRADKEVGHLTTARQSGTPASKIWDVEGLTTELMPRVEFFCNSADKLNLMEDIKPLLREYAAIAPKNHKEMHIAPGSILN